MAELVKLSELAVLSEVPLRTLREWARLRRFPYFQAQRGGTILVRPEEFARWYDSIHHVPAESKDHANKEG